MIITKENELCKTNSSSAWFLIMPAMGKIVSQVGFSSYGWPTSLKNVKTEFKSEQYCLEYLLLSGAPFFCYQL